MRTHSTRVIHLSLLALAALLAPACSSSPSCSDIDTLSETSNGTFSYTASDAKKTQAGGIGPTSGLFVVGVGGAAYGDILFNCPADPPAPLDASAIFVSGNFVDDEGVAQAFCFLIVGVTPTGTVTLGEGSSFCFTNGNTYDESCTSVAGTLETQSFSADCTFGPGCAVDIEGTLSASASWSSGSFRADIKLGHQDACE